MKVFTVEVNDIYDGNEEVHWVLVAVGGTEDEACRLRDSHRLRTGLSISHYIIEERELDNLFGE